MRKVLSLFIALGLTFGLMVMTTGAASADSCRYKYATGQANMLMTKPRKIGETKRMYFITVTQKVQYEDCSGFKVYRKVTASLHPAQNDIPCVMFNQGFEFRASSIIGQKLKTQFTRCRAQGATVTWYLGNKAIWDGTSADRSTTLRAQMNIKGWGDTEMTPVTATVPRYS